MAVKGRLETGQFRGRLAYRILPWMLLFVVIPAIIIGAAAYIRTRGLLLDQVTKQLVKIETEEITNINSWVQSKEVPMGFLKSNEQIDLFIKTLVSSNATNNQKENARTELLSQLRSLNPSATAPRFNDFIITDAAGYILASNNQDWEGLDLNGAEFFREYVSPGNTSSFFAYGPAPLYEEQSGGDLTLENDIIHVTSTNIIDNNGQTTGYILGISNASTIQKQLEPALRFLDDSTIYLVLDEETLVGITTLFGLIKIENPSSGQLEMAAAGPHKTLDEAISTYQTFDGSDAVGIYNFYPDLNIGMILEVPQKNILGELQSLAPFSAYLFTITILISSAFILVGIRRLLVPLSKVVEAGRDFAEGDWMRRAVVDRNDEIGLLAYSFNQMADQLQTLYRSMEDAVEERTQHIITASEVAHLATSATNLEELLDRTTNLIVERFDFYHSSIFLLDEAGENAVLADATGQIGQNLKAQGFQIPLTETSIVSWVAKNNEPRIVSDTKEDPLHLRHELLPDTHSEVGIPISVGNEVLGVLDVQSQNPDAFEGDMVNVLNTLANQVASAIQNFKLVEGAEIDLLQMNQLYRASRGVAQAKTKEEIFRLVNSTLQATTLMASIYLPENNQLKLVGNSNETVSYLDQLPTRLDISIEQAGEYFNSSAPVIVRDVEQPNVSIHIELLSMPHALNCETAALIPIYVGEELIGLVVLASREAGAITQPMLQPFSSLMEMISSTIEKLEAQKTTVENLRDIQAIDNLNKTIGNETDLNRIYEIIHEQVGSSIGNVEFYIALYDSATDHIEVPYMYEGGELIKIDPFPLGEGLSSIVVRTKQPLMLVENTEERARALGAKVFEGGMAKSWLGIPLMIAEEVIGILSVQDLENERRFNQDDLRLLSTLATQIAGVINRARLLEESERRAIQLQTAAEIAQETSGTHDLKTLLNKAVNLMKERFNFYHVSVFLLDADKEYAVVQESTGLAGEQMVKDQHKVQVGSQSIIGHVTEAKEHSVIHDVTQDPTHNYNPLLPKTRAALGVPLMIGDEILGALDVQSTVPYSFSSEDIEVLQILANQLAVAVQNAQLFAESQEHLAQHRLIHHVTTVAASSANIEDALSSTVQGLQVTLGDRVAILLLDVHENRLRVTASAGYEDDVVGLQIEVGQGITGWVAEHKEPLLIPDTLKDPRYIAGKGSVRSEVAVPLIFRGEILGVLNIESDEINAFDEYDLDVLSTLSGSLSAIIVNTRLSEKQRQIFEVTDKIRRSVSMETILETTATELSKVLKVRRARIHVGGGKIADLNPTAASGNGSPAIEELEDISEGTE